MDDQFQRRIVKESLAVEFAGRRKLRHLFLFNDVIVCAKYQASSKQKFTFDVNWHLNLGDVSVLELTDKDHEQIKIDREAIENSILSMRTNLILLRSQIQHLKHFEQSDTPSKSPNLKVLKKLRQKRTELEAELVLLLPHLPLVIKHTSGKKYTFFLSSNFDKSQWIESIKFLQSQLPQIKDASVVEQPSSSELQAWIQTCRRNLNLTLGYFLLRSNCDDLLYGDLNITLFTINGLPKTGNYYFCFEVDSYGHFSQKASTSVIRVDVDQSSSFDLNAIKYVLPLDGAHSLRLLLYEDVASKPVILGKALVELSRSMLEMTSQQSIQFNYNCTLRAHLSYSSSELLSMKVPHARVCSNFGMDLSQVCKKEETKVPLVIQLCVNEVERRGMREVGIYRMSGTSTDIQRLKKAFHGNSHVAEMLLRDIDIHSVTGFLKNYLRDIPEGLFCNKLYPKLVAAYNIPQADALERTRKMIEIFNLIPTANQETIMFLVDHLVRVNEYEIFNKMSLANLATVFGPNILKAPSDPCNVSDQFTAVVIGSMSQAGILYFFLERKYSNLALTELDPKELKSG